jgi:hypothetical protein
MSTFESSLAQRFSTIADVGRIAQTASPLSRLGLSGDLAGILARPPIDIGPIVSSLPPGASPPTPAQPPLTPVDAGNFLGTVAQSPQQIVAAAIHAARLAFEAVPTAQNGDVIDASIPNGFRSALITLLSLADATAQRLMQPGPRPIPPIPLPFPPGVSPVPGSVVPPVSVTPTPPVTVTPPTTGGVGILHINPGVIDTLVPQPTPTPTSPGDPAVTTPGDTVVQPAFPTIDLGGTLFDAQTITHPETGTTTTVFVERAADTATAAGTTAGSAVTGATGTSGATLAGSAFTLSPVAGGGFALSPSTIGSVAGTIGR